jgi:hypothetical protein
MPDSGAITDINLNRDKDAVIFTWHRKEYKVRIDGYKLKVFQRFKKTWIEGTETSLLIRSLLICE